MGNESTKAQLRDFIEQAIKKAQSPDLREKLKRLREKRAKKIEANYGL